MRYPLIIHPPDADGVVTIELDGLPGVTEGDSLDEAMANVPDMIWTAAAGSVAHGFALPDPPLANGRPTASVPAIIVLKYKVRVALEETGVTQSELARRLDVPRQRVTRLLDPAHNSRIGQIEAALAALGREVVVDVRQVA